MNSDDIYIQETPDLDFSENPIEETPDIHFSEEEQVDRILGEIDQETPDIDFSDNIATKYYSHQNKEGDDSDIDDLDEPDQYVEDDGNDPNTDTEADNNLNADHNDKKTGK